MLNGIDILGYLEPWCYVTLHALLLHSSLHALQGETQSCFDLCCTLVLLPSPFHYSPIGVPPFTQLEGQNGCSAGLIGSVL